MFEIIKNIKLKFDEYLILRLMKRLDKPCVIDIIPLRKLYSKT